MTVTVFGSSSTGPGTGGAFPQTDTAAPTGSVLDSQMASAQQIAATLTAAAFTSDYVGGSSTQAAQFITGGKVNEAGIQWIAYKLLPTSDRIDLQDQMVTAGALSAASVSGEATTASDSAFRSLLGIASSQNTSAAAVLALANDNGIGPIQQQLSANIAAATKEESAPIIASESNPTTIEAQANQAWTQTLGYAPSQSQLSGMVSLIQGQDVAAAETPRTAAKEEIAQAQSEESALNSLGPDGVDKVIAAYHDAVNGLSAPGAGTQQGPVSGSQVPSPIRPPGAPNGANSAPVAPSTPGAAPAAGAAQPPSGGALPTISALRDANSFVGSLPGGAVQTAKDVGSFAESAGQGAVGFGKGVVGAAEGVPSLLHSLFSAGSGGSSNGTAQLGPASQAGHRTATHDAGTPQNPGNVFQQNVPTYGGMFALSPSEWSKAQALTPSAANYTAGTAPQSVQVAAFTNLLLDTYQSTGSWSKAITQIASGTPVGEAKGSHLDTFATGIANQVNSAIEAVQSRVAAPITIKTTQPDIAAEANAQAKASDPIGYAASNYSSWAGTMSQMLYGSPTTEQNPTSDTFTGPVSPGAEAAAPAPVGA